MESDTTFGQWLKQNRKMLGLTQEELANKLSCSTINIRKIESGERKSSKQVTLLLAKLFDIPEQDQDVFIQMARMDRAPGHPISGTIVLTSQPSTSRQPTEKTRTDLLPSFPAARTSYIGREQEHTRLNHLVFERSVRLITLVGPPGVGKTRFALEAASQMVQHFSGGACFISLANIRAPEQVEWAIAQGLSVSGHSEEGFLDHLIAFLRERIFLLVLDNFEHVLEAAPLAADLLKNCPSLKILATSREPLRVYGEHEFQLLPLALPDYKSVAFSPGSLASLMQFPSVHLFVERCQATQPDFQLTSENASQVADICFRLDGLPLALELAAARIKMYAPETMLLQLKNRLRFLSRSMRDFDSRHQTLSAAIGWSYQLLDPTEQNLLDRLAVFHGPFSLGGVREVCFSTALSTALALEQAEELLFSLVEKSLVQALPDGKHFFLLETIREYTLSRQEERGEVEGLQTTHARYYLGMAAESERYLFSPQAAWWMDRLDEDYINIRAAFVWAFGGGPVLEGLQAAASLLFYWFRRSTLSEAHLWLETAVKHLAPDESQPLSARVLVSFGAIGYFLGKGSQFEDSLKRGAEIWKELGDVRGLAIACFWLSCVSHNSYLEEAVSLFRQAGDPWWLAFALWYQSALYLSGMYPQGFGSIGESERLFQSLGDPYGLSYTHAIRGHFERIAQHWEAAHFHFEEGLALKVKLGDKWGIGQTLKDLGELIYTEAVLQAKMEPEVLNQAREYLEDSIRRFRELNARHLEIVYAMHRLGNVLAAQGDFWQASAVYRETLALCVEFKIHVNWFADFLIGPAQLAFFQGDCTRAVLLLSAVCALCPIFPAPKNLVGETIFNQVRSAALDSLGPDVFEQFWQKGQILSVGEAISLV